MILVLEEVNIVVQSNDRAIRCFGAVRWSGAIKDDLMPSDNHYKKNWILLQKFIGNVQNM